MSERLTELQRQRTLAQAQVEWFDREIARTQGIALPVSTPRPLAPASPAAATPAAAPTNESSNPELEAEKILERFRHVEHPVRDDVKRGCLIYFFMAFGILALGLIVFYFLKRNGL